LLRILYYRKRDLKVAWQILGRVQTTMTMVKGVWERLSGQRDENHLACPASSIMISSGYNLGEQQFNFADLTSNHSTVKKKKEQK
jgi:hypothetical protein